LPATQAIGFFTPEGERIWAPDWDPIYAAGAPSETSGTVFTTSAHGTDTIWLIQQIDRSGCVASYVRITPGLHAGTVTVSCDDDPDGGCVVSVTYDMSLLPGIPPEGLDAFADGAFEAMMGEWAGAVSRSL
jgi:hypothetical protein